jgi:two-component system response regulator VicR
MKILIADNDFDSVEDISVALNRCTPELEFTTTNSGKQCLRMIKDNASDIVILGMQLCDTPGLQLIENIRDDSDVPVIFLSSDKNTETLVKAFDKGANDYVVKPFNNAILIARLKALVRRSNWDMQSKNKKITVPDGEKKQLDFSEVKHRVP